ncbi:MAG: 4Fe-4S dicluster domain-containing protein [Phycicoccus sp.]|nr:4Fe-4S dicluster domain-containing protein [Phycicoccus sp.]NMM34237.1 4Fe-4S dicluster domain-containing protein [Phycicoccus sp.]
MQERTTLPEVGPAGPPPGATPNKHQVLSRRNILATLGVTAAGGALSMVNYRDEAQAAVTSRTATAITEAKTAKHAWCMVIDLRTCDGCKLCTLSCQKRHDLREEQTWINVYDMPDSSGGTFPMPRPCMMCENPPCMYICPVGANIRTDEGLVLVDTDACVGSRACMAACPYEARYFNWSEPPAPKRLPMASTPQMPVAKKGTVGKCVFCADRLPHGELPACVSGCAMGVLYIGDLVTDIAVNGLGTSVVLSEFLHENDAVRLKEELGTNPRVYYIAGHGQDLGVGE